MLMNTGAPRPIPSAKGLLSTALYRMGPEQPVTYALEGAVGSCATGINWFRDSLGTPGPLALPLYSAPNPGPEPEPSPTATPSLT